MYKRQYQNVHYVYQLITCVFQVGWLQDVLITEESHDGIHYVGHNKSYDQVRLVVLLLLLALSPSSLLHCIIAIITIIITIVTIIITIINSIIIIVIIIILITISLPFRPVFAILFRFVPFYRGSPTNVFVIFRFW